MLGQIIGCDATEEPINYFYCLSTKGHAQLTSGKSPGTPWAGCQSTAGITQMHNLSHSHLWAI